MSLNGLPVTLLLKDKSFPDAPCKVRLLTTVCVVPLPKVTVSASVASLIRLKKELLPVTDWPVPFKRTVLLPGVNVPEFDQPPPAVMVPVVIPSPPLISTLKLLPRFNEDTFILILDPDKIESPAALAMPEAMPNAIRNNINT